MYLAISQQQGYQGFLNMVFTFLDFSLLIFKSVISKVINM